MDRPIKHVVGIDIAKDTFAARLLALGESPTPVDEVKTFQNSTAGYDQMKRWVREQGGVPSQSHVIMEATGVYWEACALYCHEQGFAVSIVNPAQIKYFARTTLMRGKTDPLDADLIARFGAVMKPRAWTPPGIAFDSLQVLSRQRDAYVTMLTEEKNRLHALSQRPHCPRQVLRMTTAHIRFLQKRIEELEQAFKDHLNQTPAWKQSVELLTSIPGIGVMTAGVLLTETLAFSTLVDARQLTAYAGLTPALYVSGSSVYHKPRISKIGNPRLRRAVYMASVSGIRFNPILKSFYERLRTNGKPPKVALVAVARKLLTIAFAIVQSRQPFNPNHVSLKPCTVVLCA
jgi:transposase